MASGGSEADRLVAQDRASEELWSSWVGQFTSEPEAGSLVDTAELLLVLASLGLGLSGDMRRVARFGRRGKLCEIARRPRRGRPWDGLGRY